jgi:single-strand DNA-binding protein
MNKTMITVTGNLGTTPELRATPRGTTTARLSIATTDRRRQADGTWTDADTTWHTIIARGALAEATAELPKGATLIVHGRLAHRTFTDNTGAAREVWEITADTIDTALRTGGAAGSSRPVAQDEWEQQAPPPRPVPAGRVAARR